MSAASTVSAGSPTASGATPGPSAPGPPHPLRWIAVALAVVSWIVGWTLVETAAMVWSLLPTAALILFRILLERAAGRIEPGSPAVLIGFAVHTAVVVVALWLNPFACIYAFAGYLDVERFFRGRQMVVVVVVTGLLCASGQTGGFERVISIPLLFAGLVAVNALLASATLHLTRQREREVAAREHATEELAQAYRDNAALQDRLVDQARAAGVAQERSRLSREIHDTVAQGLVAVIRQLEALPAELGGEVGDRVARAEESARECLMEARRAVDALGPHQLHDGGLVEALGDLVRTWARTNRIVTEFDADSAPAEIVHDHVLLRVAQEGLANVARHARAQTVRLRLTGSDREETLELTDDGAGFDPDLVSRGRGLDGMAERLSHVGGSLDIRSCPGGGTTITATVPR